jgi:hypothetical protein
MAINARSPHFVSIDNAALSYAEMDIFIWQGVIGDNDGVAKYQLRKSRIGSSTKVSFEIAELIRDYLDITFNGSYNNQIGKCVHVKVDLVAYNSSDVALTPTSSVTQFAFDSYSYFENSAFDVEASRIGITNRTIFGLIGNSVIFPLNVSKDTEVKTYINDVLQATINFTNTTNTKDQIQYTTIAYGDYNKFEVTDVDGTETILFERIEPCKFTAKKVIFINKCGALQDMYFFKKSVEKMSVSKDNYKANTITASNTYSINNHTKRDINIVANESITLNSGYLNETYNDVFKELMLSEKVWIRESIGGVDKFLPINVKTSNITFKTSVNDRLVDYSFKFDYSFDVINNIR